MVEAGDDIEQGRLAAARWPDDADQFSTADPEMEILEGKEHTRPAHCREALPKMSTTRAVIGATGWHAARGRSNPSSRSWMIATNAMV